MIRESSQVVIIGAGPSGLVLGELLRRDGIDNVVIERRTADHVRGRIRAGVLEPGTIDTLTAAGVGDNPQKDGLVMRGVNLYWGEQRCRIAFDLAGKHVTVYGQTRITEDLMRAREAAGGRTLYEAADVQLHCLTDKRPWVSFRLGGSERRVDCDYVIGCDGAHGVSRTCIPQHLLREFRHGFAFGWLGLLADVPPLGDEVSWVNQPQGFLMCSLRSMTRSRFYVQVPLDERLQDWNAAKFLDTFQSRLPGELSQRLVRTDSALEMSITPLESYVCETMRYGKLFLVGDAAHTVPPTGAKGLNLAVADAGQLATALSRYYTNGDTGGLDAYEPDALARVWKAVRFSWWMTTLMHRITGDPFERKVQTSELEYTRGSSAAQKAIAENFCGLV